MRSRDKTIEALDRFGRYCIDNETLEYHPENYMLACILCLTPTQEMTYKLDDAGENYLMLHCDFNWPPESYRIYTKYDTIDDKGMKSKSYVEYMLGVKESYFIKFPAIAKFGYKRDKTFDKEYEKMINIIEWYLGGREFYEIDGVKY